MSSVLGMIIALPLSVAVRSYLELDGRVGPMDVGPDVAGPPLGVGFDLVIDVSRLIRDEKSQISAKAMPGLGGGTREVLAALDEWT